MLFASGDIMQKIFDLIISFFSWVAENLAAFFNFFLDLINNFFILLLDIFYYFLQLFTAFFNSLLLPIANALPDLSPMWQLCSAIAPYWSLANDWVALNFAFGCLVAYLAFLAVMIPAKLIIKLFVPFVG